MARLFNGTTDYCDFLTTPLNLGGTGNLTFGGWFKSATVADANFHSYFSKGTGRGGGGSDSFNIEGFAAGSGGNFVVNVSAGGGNSQQQTLVPIDTKWHHLMGVWNANNAAATFLTGYFDGVNKGSTTPTGQPRDNSTTSVLIGCGHNSSLVRAEFSNITACECAVWTRLLSASEIAALAAGIPAYHFPASLVFYCPVWGLGAGEATYDGNFYTGTLSGTTFATHAPITLWTPRWGGSSLIQTTGAITPWPLFQRMVV